MLNIRHLEVYKLLWIGMVIASVCGILYFISINRTSWTLREGIAERNGDFTIQKLEASKTDMLNIITSVKTELIMLENKRENLLNVLRESENQLNSLRYEIYHNTLEADRYRISLKELSLQLKDLQSEKMPLLHLPLVHNFKISDNNPDMTSESVVSPQMCDLHQCFHWNLCSIRKHLDLFITQDSKSSSSSIWTNVYAKMGLLSSNRDSACINLHFSVSSFQSCHTSKENCVFIAENILNKNRIIKYGIIASSDVVRSTYRPHYDIVLSALSSINYEEIWPHLPPILPVTRPYFLHFMGYYGPKDSWPIEIKSLVSVLNKMKSAKTYFNFTCIPSPHFNSTVHSGEWQLCQSSDNLVNYPQSLKNSIFCLILSPTNTLVLSSISLQSRLTQCLMAGSIPVILGRMLLPFEDILPHWKTAVLRLPKARITELEAILLSYPEEDIIEMRRQGRLLLDRCLGSNSHRSRCLHLLLTHRLHLLPPVRSPFHSKSVADTTSLSRTYAATSNMYYIELDNLLGPVTQPADSVAFRRNLSSSLYITPDILNPVTGDFDPFYLYPSVPWEPVLPPQVQFQDPIPGFRPINHSVNKGGIEFSESLGGNRKYEQFTIVIVSYDRVQVLLNNIEIYNNLPYLHSILIVWNNPEPPSKSMKWPRLNVPIHVIRGPQSNSLNNRFVPYDLIKTDAVLSLDDDVDMRQDEIIFAFRTWRENRDRLVGFPSRYHAWDNTTQQWLYNSNITCEYSMILTGAAFFHRYYLYAYSFVMPASIREMVDSYMNCEDIAFNFLVSHITRKPPIKTTSRWTFICPDCKTSLHQRLDHFRLRSVCINYLTQVYGYNPLLYTQYRADSVLFKTRLPVDKQKCFKYI